MVIALLALVVAVVGTAVAGPLATNSVLNKKEKKQTRRIARNIVNSLASGLSVASSQTAANATSAGNADKVDGADACSGTVNVPRGQTQTLCSSGPISVTGGCSGNATTTTGELSAATSQDLGWFAGERITDSTQAFPFTESSFQASNSPVVLDSATDNMVDPTNTAILGLWISMGHSDPAGPSINGPFSVQANHTGTSQGTCLFSSGAVAG
jgi:hypothetical protein